MNDAEIAKSAQAYMGKTAWPTALMAVFLILAYGVVFALGALRIWPLWLSCGLIAYLLYALYTPFHEAVHNNIFGKSTRLRFLNAMIGYVVASLLGIPFTVHRSAHMAHHRATNIAGKDPDHVFKNNSFWRVLSGSLLLMISEYGTYFGKVFPKENRRTQMIVVAELAVMISWRVGLALAGFPLAVLVLSVLANEIGIMLIGIFFAWIVHTPFDKTARFENTSTILLPRWIHGPITVLWLWQNYHSIHHLFPRVPFFHYARLFDEIREGMKERGAPIIDLQG
jgi:fatty acid desaturase